MSSVSTRAAAFLRDTVGLPALLGRFRDIRANPRIRLTHILATLFFMPFFEATSLLSADRIARTKGFRRLFRCTHKMVVSDTTLKRVLDWLDEKTSRTLLWSVPARLEKEGLLVRRLADEGPLRRLGHVDGSEMGKRFLCCAALLRETRRPFAFEPSTIGRELPDAQKLLAQAHRRLGELAPDLWLLDGKYFTQKTFHIVRGSKSHLLIKCRDAEFRDVLQDARSPLSAPPRRRSSRPLDSRASLGSGCAGGRSS